MPDILIEIDKSHSELAPIVLADASRFHILIPCFGFVPPKLTVKNKMVSLLEVYKGIVVEHQFPSFSISNFELLPPSAITSLRLYSQSSSPPSSFSSSSSFLSASSFSTVLPPASSSSAAPAKRNEEEQEEQNALINRQAQAAPSSTQSASSSFTSSSSVSSSSLSQQSQCPEEVFEFIAARVLSPTYLVNHEKPQSKFTFADPKIVKISIMLPYSVHSCIDFTKRTKLFLTNTVHKNLTVHLSWPLLPHPQQDTEQI
jgi:hypothetical protein